MSTDARLNAISFSSLDYLGRLVNEGLFARWSSINSADEYVDKIVSVVKEIEL